MLLGRCGLGSLGEILQEMVHLQPWKGTSTGAAFGPWLRSPRQVSPAQVQSSPAQPSSPGFWLTVQSRAVDVVLWDSPSVYASVVALRVIKVQEVMGP